GVTGAWGATPRRRSEPVFGGISGATNTTCTAGSTRPGREGNLVRARAQDAGAICARLSVPHELVPRVAEEASLDPAILHATVGDMLAAQTERAQVERLARLVVQHHREAVPRVALDAGDDPRRVLDLDRRPILPQLETRTAIRPDGHRAGVQAADGGVGDRLRRGGPAAGPSGA